MWNKGYGSAHTYIFEVISVSIAERGDSVGRNFGNSVDSVEYVGLAKTVEVESYLGRLRFEGIGEKICEMVTCRDMDFPVRVSVNVH